MRKYMKFSAIITSVAALLSLFGCSSRKDESVVFNGGENLFFAQNDNYYFVSVDNGITAVSKDSGESHNLIADAFSVSDSMDCRVTVCGDYLYYYDRDLSDNSIKKISLSDMTSEDILSSRDNKSGFLGISLSGGESVLSDKMINSFFTDGSDLYIIFYGGDGIYRLSGNRLECIVSERLYENGKVCFDGNNIYYINRRLELKSYDIKNCDTEIISGDFTKAVYYDGTRLLYSNSEGIFSLSEIDGAAEKLSEETADELSSDGKNVVFSQNGALYILDDQKRLILDYEPTCFAVISGTNKVFARESYNNGDYVLVEFKE